MNSNKFKIALIGSVFALTPIFSFITPLAYAAISGDLNNDNKVDILDYNLVVTNFGRTGSAGDANGYPRVDILDYNLVVTNFGRSVAQTASCLTQSGGTVTINGTQASAYNNTGLSANTKIDARSANWVGQFQGAITFGGGSNICLSGATLTGTWDQNTTQYPTYHDAYGIVNEIGTAIIENVRIQNFGDSFAFGKDGVRAGNDFLINGIHLSHGHDDCIENDDGSSGRVVDSLFDGCFVGYSSRRSASNPPDRSMRTVTFDRVLMYMKQTPTSYTGGPAHGYIFKMSSSDGSATDPRLAIFNSVFRMDEAQSCCGNFNIPPPAYLNGCSGNVIVWLGSGSFPGNVPACYTVMTGQSGLNYWNNAVNDWKARHPDTPP